MSYGRKPAYTPFNNNISFKYILALGIIAALSLAGYFSFYLHIATMEKSSAAIKISGRQHMLSQRVTMFALFLIESKEKTERVEWRKDMLETLSVMEKAHDGLVNGNPVIKLPGEMSPAVRSIYFEPPELLDSNIHKFMAKARALANEPDENLSWNNPNFRYILKAVNSDLADSLDAVTAQYQKDGEKHAANLRYMGGGALSLIMLTLLIEGLFIFQPMTRRIRKEADRLIESENKLAQFKTTLDQTLDCVFMFYPDTLNFFYVNQGALNQVGYTREEMLEMTSLSIKPEFTEAEFRKMLAPMLDGSKASLTFETVHRHKNGNLISVEIFLQYMLHVDGTSHFVAMVRDITERRLVKEALQSANELLEIRVNERTAELMEANERLGKITSAINEGIVMASGNGKISYWNPAAKRIFGFTTKEAIGMDIHKLIIPKRYRERHIKGMAEFAKTGSGPAIGKTVELFGLRKNGEEFPLELSLSSIRINDSWNAISTIRDISERKDSEKKLHEQSELLKQSEKLAAIGELASGVAHELNQPLNHIHITSQLLNKILTKEKVDNNACLEELNIISENVQRAVEIIRNMRDFSRKESSDNCPFDVIQAINSAVMMFGSQLVTHNISLGMNVPEQPVIALGAQNRLSQVIVNMITNARDALDSLNNGRRKAITIDVRDWKSGVAILVKDNGSGIPKAIIKEIFNPFFTTKPPGEGTGLGLAISHKIIQEFGGELEVDSEHGEGTTIAIKLLKPKEESCEN